MWDKIKSLLFRYIPSHIDDPIGLIRRMLRSGNQAARYTLLMTAGAIAATPLDFILLPFEKRLKRTQSANGIGPYIFVCGPARSGTTVVYQLLTQHLPVAYFPNLTTLFARSPVFAIKLFGGIGKNREWSLSNYYGKTRGWKAPSEANHLWNRWVEGDNSGFRTRWLRDVEGDFRSTLTCLSAVEKRPVVSKNNNTNVFAHEIARVLPNSIFICLDRKEEYLAQSLLMARKEIRGDINQSYGVMNPDWEPGKLDPVDEVCKQVRYFSDLAKKQEKELGKERFWILSYEEFCDDPNGLLSKLARRLNDEVPDSFSETFNVPSLKCTNRIQNDELMEQIIASIKSKTDR